MATGMCDLGKEAHFRSVIFLLSFDLKFFFLGYSRASTRHIWVRMLKNNANIVTEK